MATRTFTAVIHKEEDLYVAECPEVGTVSQGYTIEEAVSIPGPDGVADTGENGNWVNEITPAGAGAMICESVRLGYSQSSSKTQACLTRFSWDPIPNLLNSRGR